MNEGKLKYGAALIFRFISGLKTGPKESTASEFQQIRIKRIVRTYAPGCALKVKTGGYIFKRMPTSATDWRKKCSPFSLS